MLEAFVCYFHSMLLEMRCQVHSELAVIEEEDGRLEAALTHLQKAVLLDNGTQRERLSSALRLLQLRGTLYHTPSRTEDKAAMLMQQVSSLSVSDSITLQNENVTTWLINSNRRYCRYSEGEEQPTPHRTSCSIC